MIVLARERKPLFGPAHRGMVLPALLILAGMLIRAPMLGDPAYKIDEQFYLLVGNRMLHGALPYVDIWDRKPIGLFLIYAFASLLGGSGIVPYQLIATACAIGTALSIFAMARRVAGDMPAAISGLLYLLWLEIAEGGGGQSPVFYGLPIALAALLTFDVAPRHDKPDRTRKHGLAAMALVGIAIQIKYTAIFEGCFFGAVLVARSWRRNPADAPREGALLALAALGPTLLACGVYLLLGHLQEFWFANFSSIFLRGATPPDDLHYRAEMALLRLIPLGVCAIASALEVMARPADRRWHLLILAWCGVSLFGFFALGALYSHYLLPVLLPFSVAAAPIFRRRPLGLVLAGLCAWLPASHLDWPDYATTIRSRRQIATLAALVPADVRRGCMQMFDGPPILYQVTAACAASRFMFPDHLSAAMEAGAIGPDPAIETRRILARRPLVITISDVDVRPPNMRTFAIMRAGLARWYRPAGRAWIDERYIDVYVRRGA